MLALTYRRQIRASRPDPSLQVVVIVTPHAAAALILAVVTKLSASSLSFQSGGPPEALAVSVNELVRFLHPAAFKQLNSVTTTPFQVE
jgi:hypothetical protein